MRWNRNSLSIEEFLRREKEGEQQVKKLRKAYTFQEKKRVVELWQEAVTDYKMSSARAKHVVSKGTGVPYNTIRKWIKDRHKVSEAATENPKRKRIDRHSKWSVAQREVEKRLAQILLDKKREGVAITYDYVKRLADELSICPPGADAEVQESYAALHERVSFARSWFKNFLERYRLSVGVKRRRRRAGGPAAKKDTILSESVADVSYDPDHVVNEYQPHVEHSLPTPQGHGPPQ